MEVFVLVEKKKTMMKTVLYVLFLFLTILCLVASLLVLPLFFLAAIAFGFGAWMAKRSCTEYEYSYFDGEVRFTKIKNKSRRKPIAVYSMDETVIIAPSGDRTVYNHENNPNMKVKNLTTGNADAKVFCMVAKGKEGQELIKFEPDEEFLDAISRKYAMKVKKQWS